jgi:hypothetical protein
MGIRSATYNARIRTEVIVTRAPQFARLRPHFPNLTGSALCPRERADCQHLRGMRRRRLHLVVWAFDLLYLDGRDLRALPLLKRRRRLERLFARSTVPCLRL